MAFSRKRGDPVRLLGKRVLLVCLFALTVAGSFGVWNTYRKEREAAALNAEAQVQAADFIERKAKLEEDIANLQTDRGKEAALREQYAFAKNGEGVIVIVDQPAQPTPTASTSAFVEWLHNAFPWW